MATLALIVAIIRRAWCQAFHKRIMLPVNGTYRCASCLEVYDVLWSAAADPSSLPAAPLRIETAEAK